MPDRDHEVRADEDHHLTGLDHLAGAGQLVVLDVTSGLEDREQRVAVPLELGPLMGGDGVLDGERMQREFGCDVGEFRLVGLVEPDPDEGVGATLGR